MSLHRFQIGMGFSLHQFRDGSEIGGAPMCGECREKAASIVIAKVVGVVVGLSQADADFSECLAKTGEMEGFGVRDDSIKVKDDG